MKKFEDMTEEEVDGMVNRVKATFRTLPDHLQELLVERGTNNPIKLTMEQTMTMDKVFALAAEIATKLLEMTELADTIGEPDLAQIISVGTSSSGSMLSKAMVMAITIAEPNRAYQPAEAS